MTIIVLIRHGETNWNIEGRYQGQADPDLNPRGLLQAHELAAELRSSGLTILFTSPLLRAKKTAQILADELGIPLFEEPRLKEIHQGDWQTKLRAEIESLYPDVFESWENNPWQTTPPGGEHLSEVQFRVISAVDDIVLSQPDQKIGLVTHRIPIALIKVHFQGMDPDIVRSIHLPNTYHEEIVIPIPG